MPSLSLLQTNVGPSGSGLSPAALLHAATSSAPIRTPQTFTAEPVFHKRSPAIALKQNVPSLHNAKGRTAAIPLLTDGKDVEYFVKVALGTPPQEVWLEIDTGSAITWTASAAIGAGKLNGQMLHNYDYTKSSTYRHQASQDFTMKYVDDTVIKGPIGLETINLGGVVLHDQSLGIGNQIGEMVKSKGNGLMGLSFGSPMVASLCKVLPDPVMSLHMVKDKGGELTLGSVDTRHLQGTINYAPVVQDGSGHWLLETRAIKINGQVIPRAPRSTALPDTGSSTIYLPPAIVRDIYRLIPGAFKDGGNWYVPGNVRYPAIELELGGRFYPIPRSQMTFSGLHQWDRTWEGAFQESVPGFPQDTLGTIFLKSYLVVLDMRNARIGLGRRNDVLYD